MQMNLVLTSKRYELAGDFNNGNNDNSNLVLGENHLTATTYAAGRIRIAIVYGLQLEKLEDVADNNQAIEDAKEGDFDIARPALKSRACFDTKGSV